MSDGNYLRFQTGVPVKVIEVKPNEYKGKKSIVVVLEGLKEHSGKRIDAKFNQPMNDITKKQAEKLFKVCGAKKWSELKDKELGIQINVSESNGKRYYNPSGYHPIAYHQTVDDLGGFDMDSDLPHQPENFNEPSTDDIPF